MEGPLEVRAYCAPGRVVHGAGGARRRLANRESVEYLRECELTRGSAGRSGRSAHSSAIDEKSARISAMVATPVQVETIPSIDPATGQVLAHFEKTPVLALPQLLAKARAAQLAWASLPVQVRCKQISLLQAKL